ncbi:MAG: hypothetical protein ACYCYM_08045 [Saccharofermentanales bacterium]
MAIIYGIFLEIFGLIITFIAIDNLSFGIGVKESGIIYGVLFVIAGIIIHYAKYKGKEIKIPLKSENGVAKTVKSNTVIKFVSIATLIVFFMMFASMGGGSGGECEGCGVTTSYRHTPGGWLCSSCDKKYGP